MLTQYWIPRKRAEPRQFFFAAIEEQLAVGVQSICAITFLVNIDVDLYTLKTCFKVRNGMFGTHYTAVLCKHKVTDHEQPHTQPARIIWGHPLCAIYTYVRYHFCWMMGQKGQGRHLVKCPCHSYRHYWRRPHGQSHSHYFLKVAELPQLLMFWKYEYLRKCKCSLVKYWCARWT